MSDYSVDLNRSPINGQMDYKKKFNMTGDIGGGSSGALIVNLTGEQYDTLDKTAAEIWAAVKTGGVIVQLVSDGEGVAYSIISAYYYPTESTIIFTVYDYDSSGVVNYIASSGDDYPIRSGGTS